MYSKTKNNKVYYLVSFDFYFSLVSDTCEFYYRTYQVLYCFSVEEWYYTLDFLIYSENYVSLPNFHSFLSIFIVLSLTS